MDLAVILWTIMYCKLNQVVSPIAAVVPDLYWSKLAVFGSWYATTDLANVFFSIPISKELQKQFVLPDRVNNIPSQC